MTYTLSLIIKIGIAIALAVVLGNGNVVAFNHLPARWFEDDGALPDRLLQQIESGRQRLPSTPWKACFVALFLASGLFLASRESVQFEVAAMLVLAIVLEMAICDQEYMIIPDQLSILLMVSAIGFLGFHEEWWEPLAGAGIGLLLSLAMWGLGRLIYKKDGIGGADLKFYTCMGLVVGREGILIIFILTTLIQVLQIIVLALAHKIEIKEAKPLLPCAFAGSLIYFLFLWNSFDILDM